MNNKYPKDVNGRPLNGINTSKRSSNLGGNNKRKKQNALKSDSEFIQSRAAKERAATEKKRVAEAKVAAKRKARKEAELLNIQLGFTVVEETETAVSIEKIQHDDEDHDPIDAPSPDKTVTSGDDTVVVDVVKGGEKGNALTWGGYLARGVR